MFQSLIYLDESSSVQVEKDVFAFKFGNPVKVFKLEIITDRMLWREEETLYEDVSKSKVTVYHVDQNPTIFLVGGRSGKMYAFT